MIKPKKILIARLSAHGDVIQTLPLLSALKSADPELFIGWVVEESAANLLEGHPLIDALHVFPRKTWLKTLRYPTHWLTVLQGFCRFVSTLRSQRYEVGIDVQGLLKSAIVLFFAGIPRRIGYRATREYAALLYTETLPYHDIRNPHIPTVLKFLEFAQYLGYIPTDTPLTEVSFQLPPVSAETQGKIQELLRPLSPGNPIIALAPATIWPSKHWKIEHWKNLLALLLTLDCHVIFLGSEGDKALTQEIIDSHPPSPRLLNLAGQTSLTDLYELFRFVDVFVGMDSAPLHIANAVGHPRIIGLFGPTGPKRTGPVGEAHMTVSTELDCQPCFLRHCPIKTHACMVELTPEMVLAAVQLQMSRLSVSISG